MKKSLIDSFAESSEMIINSRFLDFGRYRLQDHEFNENLNINRGRTVVRIQ